MNQDSGTWRPAASLRLMRQRAGALAVARQFFSDRDVLEVETPLIVRDPVSDPQLSNVRCRLSVAPGQDLFLHTSPEYHMKRLLAAGAPDMFQICKVFRDGEQGDRHLPEFTLVEWYRRDMAYEAFIAECCDFVGSIAASLGRTAGGPRRGSYQSWFEMAAGIDPLTAGLDTIRQRAHELLPGQLAGDLANNLGEDRSSWLDLILVSVVEPALRPLGLVVMDRYPAEQAALARLDDGDPRVARRFEIYLDGLELANGYHELADAGEQQRRFAEDRTRRLARGLPDIGPDAALLAALRHGLPDCCGIALGFDRLLMASLGLDSIGEAVSFTTP